MQRRPNANGSLTRDTRPPHVNPDEAGGEVGLDDGQDGRIGDDVPRVVDGVLDAREVVTIRHLEGESVFPQGTAQLVDSEPHREHQRLPFGQVSLGEWALRGDPDRPGRAELRGVMGARGGA